MPLDYSKWDNLELSDDSDIEVHPNVDKRSMIKWKQEAIHRERAERKHEIEVCKQALEQVKITLKNQDDMIEKLSTDKMTCKQTIELIEKHKKEAIPSVKPIYESFQQGFKNWDIESDKETMLAYLNKGREIILRHIDRLEKELQKMEKEANKKLTSENMFKETSNKTIINKASSSPAPKKTTEKKKTTVVETLNPNAVMKDLNTPQQQQEEEDDDEDIEVSPEAKAFAKIKGFEKSRDYLLKHEEIINEKISDQILIEAFNAQLQGDEEYCKNCIIQSFVLVYVGQLGRSGIDTFFTRIAAPNSPARKMFFDDVDRRFTHIKNRCKEIRQEQEQEVERIQLQPMGDGKNITFNIPTSEVEEEEAYKVFTALPVEFQEALKSKSLDEVNKVFDTLSVEDGEMLVKICSDYGFLDLEGEIIDQTGQQQEEQK